GPSLLRELLVNRCRQFMYSTALPPAIGLWWLDSLARVRSDTTARALLHRSAWEFRQELARRGMQASGTEYIVPVIIGGNGKAEQISRSLRAQGWDIRAIRFPTVPDGTARLRISIHANHSPALLSRVATAVGTALKDSSCPI